MTRAALITALAIGFVFGLLCAVDPQLDLDLAALGFDTARHLFVVNAQPWVQHTRTAARILIALLALPAFLAIVVKLIWPHRPMLIEARAALFLIATLALGPGLLTNVVLKDHWGRPRPIDVKQFGGDYRFEQWWDPRGSAPPAVASHRLWRGAGVWRRARRVSHGRRRAFFLRRRLCRRADILGDMDRARADLSLAGDLAG